MIVSVGTRINCVFDKYVSVLMGRPKIRRLSKSKGLSDIMKVEILSLSVTFSVFFWDFYCFGRSVSVIQLKEIDHEI